MNWLKIYTYSIMLSLLLGFLIVCNLYYDLRKDYNRVKQNQSLLLHNGTVAISETITGKSKASAQALNLTASEFRNSGDTLLHIARQAGIKPKRISEAATASTVMTAEIVAPIRPSSPRPLVRSSPDTDTTHSITTQQPPPTTLSWQDSWLSLDGNITDSVFRGTITSTDTLDIMVHRVPKRFLFFRYGCKEVRMDIISRNPHTKLIYAKYYQLIK